MTGKIIKGIAGFYYVAVGGSGIYECKAKGIFRKEGRKPLVGDDVEIEVLDPAEMTANLTDIHPRKNELIRPAVANVDQAMVFFALENPKPNAALLDRFLIMMKYQEVPVFLCFNKADLVPQEEADHWISTYRSCGYDTLLCSLESQKCQNQGNSQYQEDSQYQENSDCLEREPEGQKQGEPGKGLEEIRRRLAGRTTVVAGPSGVGKSTLTNLMQTEIRMETGEISRKLKRGKHTTRHSQLIPLGSQTFLCDTPGFTSLFLADMEKEDLKQYFPEFYPYEGQCRFQGCVHVHEPNCRVKEAVEEGSISRQRYENYLLFYEELKEKRRY